MKVDQNTKSQSAAKVPGSSKQPDDKKIETQLNVTSIATDNLNLKYYIGVNGDVDHFVADNTGLVRLES